MEMVITAEELRAHGITYDSATEFIFRGKQFKKVLSIRKLFRDTASNFYKKKMAKGKVFLLVEDEVHLTIWQATETVELSSREADANAKTSSIQSEFVSGWETAPLARQANPLSLTNVLPVAENSQDDQSSDNHASASEDATSTGIDSTFLLHCQQILSNYVGSIASLYVRETLAQSPTITHQQLVDQLAAKILNPQQAKKFQQQLLTLWTAPAQEVDSARSEANSAESTASQSPSGDKPSSEVNQYKRKYRGVSY
ncbi:MAG: hypothetical protein HC866_15265 [Leptolyngbyaceae cyanobacterium RU_5_1]|nr:hypothetical protein [Leptolyngbyaceae cyanobacterium RU_5_1]